MAQYDGPRCRLRVVRHIEAGRRFPDDLVEFEGENGAPYVWALAAGGFADGDIVEVRKLEKSPPGQRQSETTT